MTEREMQLKSLNFDLAQTIRQSRKFYSKFKIFRPFSVDESLENLEILKKEINKFGIDLSTVDLKSAVVKSKTTIEKPKKEIRAKTIHDIFVYTKGAIVVLRQTCIRKTNLGGREKVFSTKLVEPCEAASLIEENVQLKLIEK